jgi:hypothetical protein
MWHSSDIGKDYNKSKLDSGGNINITCSFVLRETLSLTLREEHRLRVFGPKRDEVIEGCRKLQNEELHNFHFRQL